MHFITPSEYSCTVDNYFSPGLQEPSALEHLWPYYGTYFQSQYVCPLAPIWFMDPSATLLTASPFDQFGIPASVFLQPFPSLSQIQITTDLSRHFPLAANRPLTAKHCPGKYFDPSSAPFLTSLCPLGKLREELKNENNL